ncbi:MAG: VWA domain-containing protein [Myxococcales bacterium]|nr:VWA domain-containing protein [Myxococcales bacterium]
MPIVLALVEAIGARSRRAGRSSPGARRRRGLLGALAAAGLSLGFAAPSPARADMLHFEPYPDPGYAPVQELSYEVIVGETSGFQTEVAVRVAIHNSSPRPQDAVATIALPRSAVLRGLRVARGGVWSDGQVSKTSDEESGRREPGTVYARSVAPESSGDLPAAELVFFHLEADDTVQAELLLLVTPQARADRWELALPGRGDQRFGLSRERRVLVKAADGARPRFWVDGLSNAGKLHVPTAPEDEALVAWPITRARGKRPSAPVDVHVTTLPGAGGSDGFRLHLRAGVSAALRPDHVVFVFDRSRSTDAEQHRDAFAVASALLDHLPARTTFDAIAYARKARPLVERGRRPWPTARDAKRRTAVANALDAGSREQGTDLAAALGLAGARLRERAAKKPLVIIMTDGMLPPSRTPSEITDALRDGLGGATRPELLFLVDEPMLAGDGIQPDHPIAVVAGALGARLTLESFAKSDPNPAALLSTPPVLDDLKIQLARGASLDDEPPTGLVAGAVVVLEGSTSGQGAPVVGVQARIGPRGPKVAVTPQARRKTKAAGVLAAVLPGGDAAKAAADGYTRPPWFGRREQRLAQLTVTWAGRGGGERKGFLDKRIFRNYLGTRVYPRARVCYSQALVRDGKNGGHAVLEMEVGKGEVMFARVASVTLDRDDPKFAACLEEAAWALDIPAGKLDDRIYRVRYPLQFSAPPGGRMRVDDGDLDAATLELLLGHGRGQGSP